MSWNTHIPKFRRFVLQNFPFIEEDFDALTDYALISKVVEYLNNVIQSQNEVITEVGRFETDVNNEIDTFETNVNNEINTFETNITNEFNRLEGLFVELKSYVDNYFDNLDVQEEINNKLDEMVDDGTLQEIITTYIQSNVAWTFDTVADMKLATNLVNGSFARTLGFYSINDGGGSLYKVTDDGTANEKDIIAIGSTLKAHLVLTNEMNVKQFGAKGDVITNDTDCLQRALTVCSTNNVILNFPHGVYLSNSLTTNGIVIKGSDATIKTQSSASTVLLTLNGISNIDGMTFDGNDLSNTLLHNNVFKIVLTNCVFKNSLSDALDNTPVENDDTEAYFENVEFTDCVGGIRYTGYPYDDRNDFKGSIKFINCRTNGDSGTTENNRLYMFTKLRYVSIQGGEFTGDATYGATNIYQVNHGEVIGGYYHDIMRGVTLGLITEYCTVTNTINENISGAGGLHIDLVTQDRVYPAGHSIIANNVVKNAFRGMYVQGKNLLITDNYIYCGSNTSSSGGVIRFNDDDSNTSNSNVIVDNLYVYNLGNIASAILCGKSVITLGKVFLDGENIVQSSLNSDNPIFKEHTRIGASSGSTHVTINDEVIIITATGSCNIMLPNSGECKTLGKRYTIVRTDSSEYSVSLRCRSDNGNINGQTSAAGNVPITKGVTNVVQTGAGEYWTY